MLRPCLVGHATVTEADEKKFQTAAFFLAAIFGAGGECLRRGYLQQVETGQKKATPSGAAWVL
jgi:hypothetical protein